MENNAPVAQISTQATIPTPSVQQKLKKLIVIVLSFSIVVLLGIIVYFLFQSAQLKKQINRLSLENVIVITPTSTTPQPTIGQLIGWKKIEIQGCSTRHKEVSYSIQIPSGANSVKKTDDQYRTVYQIIGNGLEFNMMCDTAGIGSVICIKEDGGIIDIPFRLNDGHKVEGCYKPKISGGQYVVSEAYKAGDDKGAIVFNVTKAEKATIDQALSTFKFTK